MMNTFCMLLLLTNAKCPYTLKIVSMTLMTLNFYVILSCGETVNSRNPDLFPKENLKNL